MYTLQRKTTNKLPSRNSTCLAIVTGIVIVSVTISVPLIAIVFQLVDAIKYLDGGQQQVGDISDVREACLLSRDFIGSHLDREEVYYYTVVFPRFAERHCVATASDSMTAWTVTSFVDVRRKNGAPERYYYVVETEYNGVKNRWIWTLVSFNSVAQE